MMAPDDSDDDSCVPRSRATVKLDLGKHLPPRLSFSQSDGEVKQDSNNPAGNAFEAFSFKRVSSGGSGGSGGGGHRSNGIARPHLGGLQTGLGAAPAGNAKQQPRQPLQPPAQQPGSHSKQQSTQQSLQNGSQPNGANKSSLMAAGVKAQPDALEDASPSPLVGTKRGPAAAASGQQPGAQPQARKRRALIDDSDEEAAAPAKPRSRAPLVSESPVPETPHLPAIDLTADDSPPPTAPAPPAAAPPSVPSEPDVPSPTAPPPSTAPSPVAIELSDGEEEAPPPGQAEPVGVLVECKTIAQRIRAALGDQLSAVGSQTEAQGDLAVVDRELLVAACGGLSSGLKPYQMVGVNWLLLLARLGVGGCILADEMGLGKTAQAICFLGVLKAVEQDPGPHLVVAPASLLENWQRELARWAPALTVSLYHGGTRMDVRDDWKGWEREQADGASSAEAEPPPFDVLLTTYTMFERDGPDQKEDRKFLRRVANSSSPWSHMVLDEAHAIKSKAAARTTRLRAVATGTKRRLFLTGTPLQNDLTELKTLLSFLEPDVFGAAGERLDELEESIPEEQLVTSMRGLLDTFMLRRLKEQVASQLVAKQQEERRVAMTASQAALYDEAVQRFRSEAASSADAKGSKAGAAAAAGGPPALPRAVTAKKVGNIFVHLRKVAQHPLLVRSWYTDAMVQDIAGIAHKRGDFGSAASLAQVQAELAGYSDHELHAFCAASRNKRLQDLVLPAEKMRESAKFVLLAELLPALRAGGHRALLFSQWTSILDLIEWLMQDLGLKYVRLDGSTAVADRLTIVDSYNQDPSIFAFLLSTRAGGQGLNLVGADTVLIHDSDFNPQTDRQAEDRSHRLGQERPVTIYRLITESTVDADIVNIAQRKLRLDAAVLSRGGGNTTADEKAHMSTVLAKILEGDKSRSHSD